MSKSMTENARWSMPVGWPTMNLCALYLLSCPITSSLKLRMMHSSFIMKSSCDFPSGFHTSPSSPSSLMFGPHSALRRSAFGSIAITGHPFRFASMPSRL